MLKKINHLSTRLAVVTTVALASTGAFADGLGDIAAGANFSDGKTAITAVAVGLGGFLLFGLVARNILGFFKKA